MEQGHWVSVAESVAEAGAGALMLTCRDTD